MTHEFLEQIKSPGDIKTLDYPQLYRLCDEIRDTLLTTVSKNGGHLASNLGVVELTVAIHRSFNSPEDAIVFDVGHQCYTHKLLTGRYDKFDTLRKKGGLSGFMRPDESVHDPVVTGHASTAVASALGICKANQLEEKHGYTVAVVGDGAITGGMFYEALNNAGRDKNRLIIILNDNKMSISRNVGALARQLNLIRTRPSYFRFKDLIEKVIVHIPLIGRRMRGSILRSKTMIKNAIYNSNIFEGMGINYMGPVDGHDIKKIESLLQVAKSRNRPVLLHCITIKGKGYANAEQKPGKFHGVPPFDIDNGINDSSKINFSSVFGDTLCDMAEKDDKICAVTAAMAEGTGLSRFSKEYKTRFFDVGIAEEYAVTFSAGLAKGGMKPFFAVYSSFLQRGVDQVIHDAAIANLPVTICVDRAGLVGEDGETHQGLFDVQLFSSVPNVTIYSPSNYSELKNRLCFAAERETGVQIIRYPRGQENESISNILIDSEPFSVFGSNGGVAIITYGRLFAAAFSVMEKTGADVVKLNRISPLPNELRERLMGYKTLLFFEEGMRGGGVGERLGAMLLEYGYNGKYRIFAADDFVSHSTVHEAEKSIGIDAAAMLNAVNEG